MLKIENVSIGYKKKAIVEGINLSLSEGKVTAMLGANGTGKSTLIKTISGNLKALQGIIELEGKSLDTYTRKEIARQMAVVTTDSEMAGGLRVEELVALGRIPYTGALGKLGDSDRKIIKDAMEMVGILHKRDTYVSNLSDGERQKAMIARGIAQDTPLLIMDEPFSFLDVAARIEILLLLKEIAKKENKAILYSTHEVTQALRMVEKIWMFLSDESGKKIVEGSPEEMIAKGYPDHLFDSESISFDPLMRDFIPKN